MKKAVPRMFLRSRLLIALLAPMVCHAGLDPVEQRIAAAVNHNHARYVALLEETVNIPSATENLAGVRAVGQVYAEELKQLGLELAAEVKKSGKTRSISSLNPSERRVVHVALQDDKEVRSRSVGEGLFKKVLIYSPGSKGKKASSKRRKKVSRNKK